MENSAGNRSRKRAIAGFSLWGFVSVCGLSFDVLASHVSDRPVSTITFVAIANLLVSLSGIVALTLRDNESDE